MAVRPIGDRAAVERLAHHHKAPFPRTRRVDDVLPRLGWQALPEIADWLALRRAVLESDTALVIATVSAARSPGAAQRADAYVAQRRLAAGNVTGALDIYRRWRRSLDIARVEFALGQRRTARLRADSVLLLDPTKPQAMLAANLLREQRDTLMAREEAGVARVYRALNDLASAERILRSHLLPSQVLDVSDLPDEDDTDEALARRDSITSFLRQPADAPCNSSAALQALLAV
jgi:hypothetical protein